jgi:three-Cys-motif partner protein
LSNETENFFEGKRPWSKVKDRILASYLTPYLSKVKNKGKEIILIDAFAGPGVFEDASPGSPLLICKAAKSHAGGNYRAIFINNKRSYHEKLDSILRAGEWYPKARAILGDSQDLLKSLPKLLDDQTVFLYLDPFGLKGCEFSTLVPFLNRKKDTSTEIVVNLCMPILHRLAGREKLQEGTIDPQLQARRFDQLTRVLGGDYWKEALLSEGLDTKQREIIIVQGYRQKLSENGYLAYTGACPIQEARDSATKYYMIFASTHRDSRKILNDEMLKAFNEYMNQQEMKNTMFEGLSWKDWRDTKELQEIVLTYVGQYPGNARSELWHIILQDYFLRFTESEYKRAVKALYADGSIKTPTTLPRNVPNDQCILYLV